MCCTVGQVRSDKGIDAEIKNFEERFISLRQDILKELTEVDCKISVREFRQALIILPSSITNENKHFVLSNYQLFEKAESIESIFAHLSVSVQY